MENRESTSCGWCPSELLPWIQSQDPKKLFAFGIAMILIAGKLKVAFSQKGLMHSLFLQTGKSNYFPELEF